MYTKDTKPLSTTEKVSAALRACAGELEALAGPTDPPTAPVKKPGWEGRNDRLDAEARRTTEAPATEAEREWAWLLRPSAEVRPGDLLTPPADWKPLLP